MDDLDRQREDRPSEQAIRDRLRNRRSLYELHRSMETPSMRLRRTVREGYGPGGSAAGSREAIWRRHPVKSFIGVSLLLIGAIPLGAALLPAGLLSDPASKPYMPMASLDRTPSETPAIASLADDGAVIIAEKGGRLDSDALNGPAEVGETGSSDTQSKFADDIAVTSMAQSKANALDLRFPDEPAASAPLPSNSTMSEAPPALADRELTVGSIRPRDDEPVAKTHLDGLVTALASRPQSEEASVGVLRSASPTANDVAARERAEPAARHDNSSRPQPTASLESEASSSAPAIEPKRADGERPKDDGSKATLAAEGIASGTKSAASTAIANANVNMREKPENEATILAVLGRGEAVTVVSCEGWCEVIANGTTGYVYSSFLDEPADDADR